MYQGRDVKNVLEAAIKNHSTFQFYSIFRLGFQLAIGGSTTIFLIKENT
jgi:hypothetical protein